MRNSAQSHTLRLFYPAYRRVRALHGSTPTRPGRVRPGIHLEDIFVEEAARRHGVGKRLMQRLAAIAVERGCARLELQVLDWNPAREFYRRLDLEHMQEWLLYRVDGQALRALARDEE